MTEREWVASTDPQAMLAYLSGTSLCNACDRGRHDQCGDRESRSGRCACLICWGTDIGFLTQKTKLVSDRKLRLFACACCRSVFHLLTDARSRNAVEVAEKFADGEVTEGNLTDAWVAAANVPCTRHELAAVCAAHWDNNIRQGNSLKAISDECCVPLPEQAALLREIVGNPFRPVTLCERNLPCDRLCKCLLIKWRTPTVRAIAAACYTERVSEKCGRCDEGKIIPDARSVLALSRAFPLNRDMQRSHMKDCPDCHGTGRLITSGHLDADRLGVLSDALEDAGCDNDDILRHLRGQERCHRCGGAKSIETSDAHGYMDYWIECRVCNGTGWTALRGPHVRGCWVLDLLTGRE